MKLCLDISKAGYINEKDYIWQLKYDGIRITIEKSENGIRLLNREGKEVSRRYPECEYILKDIPNGVYDTEFCVVVNGKNNFQIIQSREHTANPYQIRFLSKNYPVSIFVFDIMKLSNKDLRNKSLIERLDILNKAVKENDHLKIVESHENKQKLWEYVQKHDLEGIIGKKKVSRYDDLRNINWVKIKNKKETTLKITEYENTGTGIVLISNKNKHRITLNGKLSELVKSEIDKKGFIYANVEYLEKTENGRLRQPICKGVEYENRC